MSKRVRRGGLPSDAVQRRRSALGKILREARLRRGAILGVIAKSIGVSIPFLSELERGVKVISNKRLDALSKALQLTDDEYVRVFQLKGRLPPSDEAWFMAHPEQWPSRRKG